MHYELSFSKEKTLLLLTSCTSLMTLIFFLGYVIGQTLSVPQGLIPGIRPRHHEEDLMTPSYAQSAIANPSPSERTRPHGPEIPVPEPRTALVQRERKPLASRKTVKEKPFLHLVETPSGWTFASSHETFSKRRFFAVLAGSFPDKAEAGKKASRLIEKGWRKEDRPYIYQALARDEKWHNVLIGKYGNLEEASQTLARFRQTEKLTTAVIVSISENLPFTILVNAFLEKRKTSQKRANQLVSKLEAMGYAAQIHPASDSKGQNWLTVLLDGEHEALEPARSQASPLKQSEKMTEVTYKELPYALVQGDQLVRSLRKILDGFPIEDEGSPHHPYTIQVATYATRKRAMSGIEKMERHGLSPYLVKSGKWWVAYMGHYSTKEKAENARKNAKKTIRTATRRSDSLVRERPYSNFIGSVPSDDKQTPKFQRLEKSGYTPYLIKGGEDGFWMFVGAFKEKKDAEKQNQGLGAAGIPARVKLR